MDITETFKFLPKDNAPTRLLTLPIDVGNTIYDGYAVFADNPINICGDPTFPEEFKVGSLKTIKYYLDQGITDIHQGLATVPVEPNSVCKSFIDKGYLLSQKIPVTPNDIVIVTHDGGYQADELMAMCLLGMAKATQNFVFVRFRQKELLKKAKQDPTQYVIDVGGENKPELNNFDHHQDVFKIAEDSRLYQVFNKKNFTPTAPMSACGLIFYNFCDEIVKYIYESFLDEVIGSLEVETEEERAQLLNGLYEDLIFEIYTDLIQVVDADDTGTTFAPNSSIINICKNMNKAGVPIYSAYTVVRDSMLQYLSTLCTQVTKTYIDFVVFGKKFADEYIKDQTQIVAPRNFNSVVTLKLAEYVREHGHEFYGSIVYKKDSNKYGVNTVNSSKSDDAPRYPISKVFKSSPGSSTLHSAIVACMLGEDPNTSKAFCHMNRFTGAASTEEGAKLMLKSMDPDFLTRKVLETFIVRLSPMVYSDSFPELHGEVAHHIAYLNRMIDPPVALKMPAIRGPFVRS